MGELMKQGERRPVTQGDLAISGRAQGLQALHQVPVLQRADNPHDYLFFALFDGTGQDVDNPDQLPTNIGILKKQLDQIKDGPRNRVGGHYVEGIGTQSSFFSRGWDGLTAFTWDERIEDAYRALARQTSEWQRQDPQAQIRIAEVGYSRGAVLAAGLARLVDRYGIADPENLTFGRDAHGNITVDSSRPRLVAPGQTAQALGLFDPVATNLPKHFDARPAPSVISGLALAGAHDRRTAFEHQTILEPGLSPDRRFINLLEPGGHSNVGGGNRDHGLEAMAFNRMADYLNALRDQPLFEYRPLPDDPALYTVYQARGVTALLGLDRDGIRDLREELANCKIVDPCRDAEPMNRALAARFEYRAVPSAAPMPAFLRSPQEAAQAVPATATPPSRPMRSDEASVPYRQSPPPQATAPDAERTRESRVPVEVAVADARAQDIRMPFSDSRHPQYALYADARERLEAQGHHFPEDRLNQITAQLHKARFKPGWEGYVEVHGAAVFAMDYRNLWGGAAKVPLDAPAPPIQVSMEAAESHDRSIAQASEAARQRQQQAMGPGVQAPVMG